MLGLMQDRPLLISDLLTYAATYHRTREVISRTVEGPFHRYTYPEAARRAAQVANGLLAYGIRRDDRIATLAWNTYRHFELFYGVSGIGAVLHTVNPRLFQEQIVYIINHAEDRLVFLDVTFVQQLEAMQHLLTTVEAFVVLCARADMPATSLKGALCYEDWLAGQSAEIIWPSFDERQASSLCYTSGTTGNPKGVLYSHRSTVIHAFAAASNAAMGISVHDAIMPIAPMYHGNGWSLPYIAAMCGANLVLPGPKMDGPSIHEIINRFGVSFSVAVPTVWTMLLEHMERTDGRIDSLRRVAIGGSAVPRAMIETLRDRYGCTVHQLWGMTETSPLGTMATTTPEIQALGREEEQDILCQQGRVQFGLELKLKTPEGADVPHDGVSFGDLWVRGPWAASGYFKGEGGAKLDNDGWFPTGDVATIDPYGYLRITDRTKDVIKSGGEWISSIDLENAAYGHTSVKMAAVIGVAHPKWEERPLLVVVLAEGAKPDKQAILDYLATKVAKWWLPDDIAFVDAIPLTATGKIQKTRLRDQFKDYRLPGV